MDPKAVNILSLLLLLVGIVAILAMAFNVPILNLSKTTLIFVGVACVAVSGLVKGLSSGNKED